MTRQLSASQHVILADAINHSDGKLNRFPDNIKGAAGTRVLDAREVLGKLVLVPWPISERDTWQNTRLSGLMRIQALISAAPACGPSVASLSATAGGR